MKLLVLPLLLMVQPALAETYVSATHGVREQAYSVSIGYLPLSFGTAHAGVELAFASMGKQPEGFNNINRMVDVSFLVNTNLSENLSGFGRVGFNNTEHSHNGTNNYDRSKDSLWGVHTGIGLSYQLTGSLSALVQVTTYAYRQVNNPNIGGFTFPSIGLKYTLEGDD